MKTTGQLYLYLELWSSEHWHEGLCYLGDLEEKKFVGYRTD